MHASPMQHSCSAHAPHATHASNWAASGHRVSNFDPQRHPLFSSMCKWSNLNQCKLACLCSLKLLHQTSVLKSTMWACSNATTRVSACKPLQSDVASCPRWVDEYHVDGFRFDLASCLCRDSSGNPLAAPPLIRDLAKDPVLSKVLCHALI